MAHAHPRHPDPEVGEAEDQKLLSGDTSEHAEGLGQRVLSGGGLRVRRTHSGMHPDEAPVSAAGAFAEDAEHKNPMLDGGDLPLRALAQGLSMLSLDELRRLRLPTLPWQTGDDGQPSMLENLRRKPWKAHYTSLMGFVISTGALIAHLWCAVVACLLIVFVSQSCPPNDANPDRHECKLSEATTNLSGLGRLVVTFNWVSFISFLFSEVVYFRREAFLISHFDDNDAAPYNQLPTFITRDEHGHMLEGLRSHNKVARVSALGMLILCSCNLFFSCCLLLTPPARGGRYNGTRTLVTLVSNTLLLARRVVQNARISNLSTREDLALSLYQMKFRSFNDLASRRKAAAEAEANGVDEGGGGEIGAMSPLAAQVMLASSIAGTLGESRSRNASGASLDGLGGARHSHSRSFSGDGSSWGNLAAGAGSGHAPAAAPALAAAMHASRPPAHPPAPHGAAVPVPHVVSMPPAPPPMPPPSFDSLL